MTGTEDAPIDRNPGLLEDPDEDDDNAPPAGEPDVEETDEEGGD